MKSKKLATNITMTHTNKLSKYRLQKQKERREEILALLAEGKTSWEIFKMGYSFATARYHETKLKKPEQHARFMERHKAKQRAKRLSTQSK